MVWLVVSVGVGFLRRPPRYLDPQGLLDVIQGFCQTAPARLGDEGFQFSERGRGGGLVDLLVCFPPPVRLGLLQVLVAGMARAVVPQDGVGSAVREVLDFEEAELAGFILFLAAGRRFDMHETRGCADPQALDLLALVLGRFEVAQDFALEGVDIEKPPLGVQNDGVGVLKFSGHDGDSFFGFTQGGLLSTSRQP